MFDGAIHSAFETGKCTERQRNDLISLQLAFDAFAEAAVTLGKIHRVDYEQLRESILPEYAFVGDVEACQERMLLFLRDNGIVDTVYLQGLQSRPDLNGLYGKVCGVPDHTSGRWPIEVWVDGHMSGKKEPFKLKTQNLRPAIDNLSAGDGCVIFGMRSGEYNGAYCNVIGPLVEGRYPCRIRWFGGQPFKDIKVKSANLTPIRMSSGGTSGIRAEFEAAASAYIQLRPWKSLFATHLIEFSYGALHGCAASMGDPARGSEPRMMVAPTIKEMEGMVAGRDSPNVQMLPFTEDGSAWDGFVRGDTPYFDFESAIAGLGADSMRLFIGGLRAVAAFVKVAVRTDTPTPTLQRSCLGDFHITAGADNDATSAVVFRYPPRKAVCATCGQPCERQQQGFGCPGVYVCSESCGAAYRSTSECRAVAAEVKFDERMHDFGALTFAVQTAGSCVSLGGYLTRIGLRGHHWWGRLGESKEDYTSPHGLEQGLCPLAAEEMPRCLCTQLCSDPFAFVRNWSAWCAYRGVPPWSPVPLLFHDALTIFHAIHLALGDAAHQRDELLVHVIGVEKEARDLGALSELAALLPTTQTLRLHLIGPAIEVERDNEEVMLPRPHAVDSAQPAPASATLLRSAEYSAFVSDDARYSRPDLIVGLNAGLCAPSPPYFGGVVRPWDKAVQRMIADRVPAIFTDYMRASCMMPLLLWGEEIQAQGGTILEPQVNPFRQPWSRHGENGKPEGYACMANGHIYGWRF